MIAFQWRPPWSQLVTATCKHSRSVIKGKAPENCVCLRPATRDASTWSQMALPGGAEASSSTSTSSLNAAPSGADLLFFYPSFHFDVARSKVRNFKHIRRAVRRTLGHSRSMLHGGSASPLPFAKGEPTSFRAASHSSAMVSNMPSVDERLSTSPPAFETLPYRKNGKSSLREDCPAREAAADEPYFRQDGLHSQRPQVSEELGKEPSTSTDRTPPQTARTLRRSFRELVTRVYEKLSSGGTLKEARWRLYALLRLMGQGGHNGVQANVLHDLVSKICRLHLSNNDIPHIEEIVRRTEALLKRYTTIESDIHTYNTLLVAYCRALRVTDAYNMLDRIRASNLQPNESSYLALVTMHAHLKDPESAQKLLEVMDRNYLPIGQKVYASLMNAYVEAGFWDDAIRIFDFLDSHSEGHVLKPDLHTCTTLLKCYVLMGAPLDEVMRVFNIIQSRGHEPGKKTYALLLRAACDAGALDFAEEIFARLDEEVDRPSVNVFAFTIMIRGMLRAGKQEVANEYYQEMRRRGIEPTSATWSVLMQAYAKAGKPETNALLTDLLAKYLETHIDTKTGRMRLKPYTEDKSVARGTAVENVYGPVISALGKGTGYRHPKHDSLGQNETISPAQAALNLFSDMLRQPGGRPSLHLYTALLDAYRRVDDVDGVQELWSHIVTYAREMAATSSFLPGVDEASRTPVSASRRNLLCLPLSIYIEAMSSRHRHQEVAQAWQELQSLGFGFDVGNWNHLIAAFVRAGDIDRAFWIAEELLRDGQVVDEQEAQKADSNRTESQPGAITAMAELEDVGRTEKSVIAQDKAETPMRPPNRSWQYHQDRKRKLLREKAFAPALEVSSQPQGRGPVPASQPVGIQEGHDPPATTNPQPVESANAMTASYPTLQRQRHAQTWTVFASTLQLLEEALWRDSAGDLMRSTATREGDHKVVPVAPLDDLQRKRQEQYPLTTAAINAYREKRRLRS